MGDSSDQPFRYEKFVLGFVHDGVLVTHRLIPNGNEIGWLQGYEEPQGKQLLLENW